MGEVQNASLWALPGRFLVANDVRTDGGYLSIDRSTYRMEMDLTGNPVPVGCHRQAISGIAGIIQLVSGPHLIVITKKEKVGHLSSENHAVWRVTGSSILPFSSHLHLTEDERTLHTKQLQLVEELLKEKHFYFSYTYDLTSNQQRLNSVFCQQAAASSQVPIASCNTQFAWNYNILRPFCAKVDFLAFCVALVHGAVFINNCSVNGKYFRWTIISRRSNRRAGTRFYRRGADMHGNVANFVETEQMVELGESVSSFVQTRGSMPMFWKQEPDLRYMPKPSLDYSLDSGLAFRAHFQDQTNVYGSQMIVNLVNHSKDEGRLENMLSKLHRESGMSDIVGYQAFDFHKECSKMRWDRLSILIERLKNCLTSFGCFIKTKHAGATSNGYHPLQHHQLHNGVNGGGGGGSISQEATAAAAAAAAAKDSLQRGVFRTNCMDCLDRTNVVQSLLARENLNFVLRQFGLLKEGMTTHYFPDFEKRFRHVWADHANLLAMQYAGSGALKTDYTRTGQRTLRGALEDLGHALMRYWKNNFCDGQRQDAIDLFLGSCTQTNVKVMIEEPHRKWLYLPLLLLADLSLLLLTLIFAESEFESSHHLWILFLLATAILLASLVLRKSQLYVNKPKFT